MRALDTQVGGDHYKNMAIQPVAFIQALQMGFCEGNVVKYLARWRLKNGPEDLGKAGHYLELLWENKNYQGVFYASRERGRRQWPLSIDAIPLDLFLAENAIVGDEATIISHLFWWNKTGRKCHLDDARTIMRQLMASIEGAPDRG